MAKTAKDWQGRMIRGFSEIIIQGLNRCKLGLARNLDMDSIQTDGGYKPWLLRGTGTHVRKAGLPNHNLPLLLSISLGTMTTT